MERRTNGSIIEDDKEFWNRRRRAKSERGPPRICRGEEGRTKNGQIFAVSLIFPQPSLSYVPLVLILERMVNLLETVKPLSISNQEHGIDFNPILYLLYPFRIPLRALLAVWQTDFTSSKKKTLFSCHGFYGRLETVQAFLWPSQVKVLGVEYSLSWIKLNVKPTKPSRWMRGNSRLAIFFLLYPPLVVVKQQTKWSVGEESLLGVKKWVQSFKVCERICSFLWCVQI